MQRKKQKELDKIRKCTQLKHVDTLGLKPSGSSYIWRKSSEIRKLLPKSLHKVVNILKHLWDQLYKSPRKRILLDEFWCKDKKLPKYMYLAGKYRNKKNVTKLTQTVSRIKKHYKSRRSAWRQTDMNWSQFH